MSSGAALLGQTLPQETPRIVTRRVWQINGSLVNEKSLKQKTFRGLYIDREWRHLQKNHGHDEW
jgi:hypothetical protein